MVSRLKVMAVDGEEQGWGCRQQGQFGEHRPFEAASAIVDEGFCVEGRRGLPGHHGLKSPTEHGDRRVQFLERGTDCRDCMTPDGIPVPVAEGGFGRGGTDSGKRKKMC